MPLLLKVNMGNLRRIWLQILSKRFPEIGINLWWENVGPEAAGDQDAPDGESCLGPRTVGLELTPGSLGQGTAPENQEMQGQA